MKLETLGEPVPCLFEDGARKLRWIEAVYGREDGLLFGLYHREEYLGEYPDREYFTVPDIGVARSTDQGRTWKDLGIVLQDLKVERSCEPPNKFFAGGVGDPSWTIDRTREHAYIFFSSYTDPLEQQGIQIARIALSDLESPVGKVWRWSRVRWNTPGIGGKGTPVVPARIAWSKPDADAFWGPSIHWNTYLETYVHDTAQAQGWRGLVRAGDRRCGDPGHGFARRQERAFLPKRQIGIPARLREGYPTQHSGEVKGPPGLTHV